MIISDLKKPFPPTAISWRVGATNSDKSKGIALAYLTARDVMDRLDSVCGPENWQCEYPFPGCCRVGIKCGDEWVWKANGVGDAVIRDGAKEEEQSMKEKGNYSDAFKRAAVLWGIGQYLYDLPNAWVDLEQKGRSQVITKEAKADLTKRLGQWQKTKFGE